MRLVDGAIASSFQRTGDHWLDVKMLDILKWQYNCNRIWSHMRSTPRWLAAKLTTTKRIKLIEIIMMKAQWEKVEASSCNCWFHAAFSVRSQCDGCVEWQCPCPHASFSNRQCCGCSDGRSNIRIQQATNFVMDNLTSLSDGFSNLFHSHQLQLQLQLQLEWQHKYGLLFRYFNSASKSRGMGWWDDGGLLSKELSSVIVPLDLEWSPQRMMRNASISSREFIHNLDPTGVWWIIPCRNSTWQVALTHTWISEPSLNVRFWGWVTTGSRCLLLQLAFSESCHFDWDIVPVNTIVYYTLPHDWRYQGEVMQKKHFVLGKNLLTWW